MKNNRFGGLIVGLLVMLLAVPVSQAPLCQNSCRTPYKKVS